MTSVISVRGRDRKELLANPYFLYVGRGVVRSGWVASDWGNIFKEGQTYASVRSSIALFFDRENLERFISLYPGQGKLTKEQAVVLYRDFVLARSVVRIRLGELQGKVLGCWCGNWMPGEPEIVCHAVELAKLADQGA